MKLSRSKILNLYRGISCLKGTPKALRDKDGNVIVNKDGGVTIEQTPISISPKAKYACSRTLDAIRAPANAIEDMRQGFVADAHAAKRLRTEVKITDGAETKIFVSDPESAELTKSISPVMEETVEVELHLVDVKEFRFGDNPDFTADMLTDLLPMTTGEL